MLEWCNGRTPGVQGATGPPSLVQLLYTESTGIVMVRFVGGAQSHTAGVRKCRSLQIVHYNLVNMLEWCNGLTAVVQGATGLRSLVQVVYTHPTKAVQYQMETTIQIHTAGVHKCRSLHIVYHGLLNILKQSKVRTPGVQVAMGPLSLVPFVYT